MSAAILCLMSTSREDEVSWFGIDDVLKPLLEASTSSLEAGASVGWGVFTTGAIRHGRPLLLEAHIRRLQNDAIRARLLSPRQEAEQDAAEAGWKDGWTKMLEQVVHANHIEHGLFRLTFCARGEGRWHPEGAPRKLVAAIHGGLGTSPARLWLSPYHIDARRPLSGVKSTSYAPWHMMSLEARARGCHDAVYRDSAGAMCEAARSSLFWRRGHTVFTPALSTGCLPGIGRAQLISWMAGPSSPWQVREVQAPLEELRQADEIFLSSATLGPREVMQLLSDEDGEVWSSRNTNDACARLRERWKAEVEGS